MKMSVSRKQEDKHDRPSTAPELSTSSRIGPKLSISLPSSLDKYRNLHDLQPLELKQHKKKHKKQLKEYKADSKKKEKKSEDKEISMDVRKLLTKQHIIEESTEVLSWVPTKEEKHNHVVLHYQGQHSPLFETMQLVRGETQSKTFNPVDFGYQPSYFIHREFPPNSSDQKQPNYESKDKLQYLKGAKIIIPVCYGVKNPIEGKKLAAIAKNYIEHHHADEVVIYLGRYSDSEFKIPLEQLARVGQQKKNDWLAKNKAALIPKNIHDSTDFLHKVKIVEREAWVQHDKYKQAAAIVKFFLETELKITRLNINDLISTIEKDVETYSNHMQNKDKTTYSPVVEPIPNKQNSSGSSTRLVKDVLESFTLGPSAFSVEADSFPVEHLSKVCELDDDKAVEKYVERLAMIKATYFVKFRLHLMNQVAKAQEEIESMRNDLTLSPTCSAEALKSQRLGKNGVQ